MKECKIVKDLWPLYIDGELSAESKSFVEEHLATCPECSKLSIEDKELKIGDLMEKGETYDGSAEAFLITLRQRIQKYIVTFGFLIFIVVMGSWYYTDWNSQRAYQRESREKENFYLEQKAALEESSPPGEEILEKLGISFSITKEQVVGNKIKVEYMLKADKISPVEWLTMKHIPGQFENNKILNAESKVEISFAESGSSSSHKETTGSVTSMKLETIPKKVILVTPVHYAYLEKDEINFKFNYTWDGKPTTIPIQQNFSYKDVKFVVENFEISDKVSKITYRQLTPPKEVGVYQLDFEFNDRLGNHWSVSPEVGLDTRDTREFVFPNLKSPSKNWILEGRVVQVIPSITKEIELKEGN